ncbi:undecaprenyl-diphosphate phosphatase [Desulfosporosinus sp. BICA1-9]|uniref:undecaprenyl-diphosphate phosphatase n=1 Tax=Desulfosporosinus sp. BICA1-9 TaxID=1531958 RepID=UPI00054BC065|nr:undecaprenyl-diphosphate phosphatase [Desulfosporosinus sp. BICA1-9]KJS48229.1 MAG: UDP pyrophosphate phosphatase [Peptococcaceae bacterium BRH_c23]KJS83290.1 MAG: UDP pyrophosphate phosphatase [Desulfosporosinus sp. BICA1-9]HBW38201.1 undecaprenyl-diphosphate phosphatase [Desulfosporosinus sp.]
MNDFLSALILGIVEGITEFLPISSTGHLIIFNQFVGFTEQFANMFDVVIQLGAILSVVVYFRKRLIPFGNYKSSTNQKIFDLWKKTLVGVIPALGIGFLVADYIEERLFNTTVVAIALIVGGLILLYIENKRPSLRIKSMEQLTYRTAFFIGIIQCLAMIPGTSRSASTIIGAMLLGASRVVAAEFSFFLAIPTMVAASGYTLLKNGFILTPHEFLVVGFGFVVSFIVAWAVIAGFMSYVSKKDFKPFGYYRIVLGIIVLAYFSFL